MEKTAVVEVELSSESQVFSESVSGALEFEGAFTLEESAALANRLLGGVFPRVELPYPDDNFGSPVYCCNEDAGRWRVYARMTAEAGSVSSTAQGFFARYPAVAAALRAGAFGTAGRILDRSRKLAAYRPLLRYLFGERAFLAFALFWLGEFDGNKQAALENLLSDRIPNTVQYGAPAGRDSPYSGVFDVARSTVSARDFSELERECAVKLRALLLDRKEPLVLEVAGVRFRSCIGELASRVASAREEALTKAIAGDDSEEAMRRIREFVGSIQVLLAAEPYNPYDPNAVSILLRFPDGRTEQAGYVKREIAAILAPIIREGAGFSGRIYKLCEAEAEVQVEPG